jgi:hypothetical protein
MREFEIILFQTKFFDKFIKAVWFYKEHFGCLSKNRPTNDSRLKKWNSSLLSQWNVFTPRTNKHYLEFWNFINF